MRPDGERYWRKTGRRAIRQQTGRRGTHPTLVQAPRQGSTWLRRHPGELTYYLTHAGTRRLLPAPGGDA